MDLCRKHSVEIAFEGSICPACDEVDDLKTEIDELSQDKKDLQATIEKLEGKV